MEHPDLADPILQRNLLKPEAPNYQPDPRSRCIHAHYPEDGNVILTGFADNNYIFWMSVTETDDLDTNRRILAYLTEHEPEVYGHTAFSLKNTPYSYEEFRYFYSVTVTCAEDIPALYQQAKERTGRDRSADQKLVSRLQKYQAALSGSGGSPSRRYDQNNEIFREVWNMTYLRVSDNPQIRALYHQLELLCSGIYNAYMTEAR